ncbi:MAG: class I SAM-dependent methyltransferase [bacterium]|nr:class I SAM-dependent methyltransferase [bacterium]
MEDKLLEIYSKAELDNLVEQCSSGGGYEHWLKARHFVTKAIHKDGSFLDIGCSNGFLLKCLQHWTPYTLEPYGIEHREEAVCLAKELFSDMPEHIELLDGNRLIGLKETNLPDAYDYVFRNHWKRETTENEMKEVLSDLFNHTKEDGRVIVGLYWPNSRKQGTSDFDRVRNEFLGFADKIKSAAAKVDGEAFSDIGDHWIMWMDKNS